jgi:hypothetical protein
MNRRSIALTAGIVVAIGVPTAMAGPASADTSTKQVTVDGTVTVKDLATGQVCGWSGADVHTETAVKPSLGRDGDRTAWERTCGALTVHLTTGLRQLPSHKTVDAAPKVTVNGETMAYGLRLEPDGGAKTDQHAWSKDGFTCEVNLTWVTRKSAPADPAR